MIDVAVYNTINGRFLHAIEINKNKNKINYISWTPCVPIYKDLYGEHTHQKNIRRSFSQQNTMTIPFYGTCFGHQGYEGSGRQFFHSLCRDL